MPSYEHKKLIERISQLDKVPENVAEYAAWIKAEGHLALLQDNAQENELAIYASSNYTSIQSVLVSEDSFRFYKPRRLARFDRYFFILCELR